MKLKHLPGCVDQMKAWRRYLKSMRMYSGSINDSPDMAFEKVLVVVLPSGKLIKTEPGGQPHFHVEF